MKILYLDTSSSFLYSGVVINNKLEASIKKEFGKTLSIYTLTEIKKMFSSIKMSLNDIDKIIVVNGPGSFTGIRIAITIAKTIAWSLRKKISTISSLDAMALSTTGYDYIIPYIDAKRDYGYFGVYDKNNNTILPNKYIPLSFLKNYIKEIKNYIVVTNDNIDISNKINYDPDILNIVNHYALKENINAHLVNPNYLKLTEAEENNDKRN
ncbi:MAG: tRNA (adenosine(37)-N6)-threonylcarbamoyltransferase complex dimerization subunit type 1 TsaB [Tenericutes bacterium]|nr:tRNA (adenosine(37)-N6)-threonylcarbamoyltransferase complex dimerization subunit type 1 TsaB [Mycoplasmatota bacterium]